MIFLHGGVPCNEFEAVLYAILALPFIKPMWEYAKHKLRRNT